MLLKDEGKVRVRFRTVRILWCTASFVVPLDTGVCTWVLSVHGPRRYRTGEGWGKRKKRKFQTTLKVTWHWPPLDTCNHWGSWISDGSLWMSRQTRPNGWGKYGHWWGFSTSWCNHSGQSKIWRLWSRSITRVHFVRFPSPYFSSDPDPLHEFPIRSEFS